MSSGFNRAADSQCTIRPFAGGDLDEVLLIEAASFPFPWLREMFEAELARGDVSRCYVALFKHRPRGEKEMREEVAGYLMAWQVADELHITNLAVAPSRRRSGLGGALLAHALGEAARNGATWCQLEVRTSNVSARVLYERSGFRSIGVRRGYYQDGEDAVVMGKELGNG